MAKKPSIVLPEPIILGESSGLVPPGKALVMGLTWKVLLGQSLDELALAESIKAKASHFTHSGRSGSVGYTRFKADPKLAYLSLANLFAASNPISTAFVALTINDSDVWVCGVSNGSVLTGYDVITDDLDTVESMKEGFGRRFADANFLGDAGIDGLDENYAWDAIQELLGNNSVVSAAGLKIVKGGLGKSMRKVPKPLIYLTLLGISLFAFQKAGLPLAKSLFAPKEQAVVEDPEVLWADALEGWLEANRVSGPSALNEALNGIGDVPIIIAGWRAKSIECSWTTKAWKCIGEYKASSRLHTNSAFDAAKPTSWLVSWSLLQGAKVSFDLPTASHSIVIKSLKPVSEHQLVTASKVQMLSPLLTAGDKAISSFARIAVPPPKLANGGNVPPSTAVVFPLVAKALLKSPLRTAAAMQGWADDVSWTRIVLTFDLKREPGINESSAVMELAGNIYARP